MSVPLAAIEAIAGTSGVAPQIQALLPRAVRHRQLSAQTLLIGMHLTLAGGRPAHLTQARNALIALPEAGQERLGVLGPSCSAMWVSIPALAMTG